MFLHLDCRYYLGDRPCKFARACEACPHYAPMGPRALMIKLGALGDVVRTSALVPGLARLLGEPPHLTWLTDPGAVDLVARVPGVDQALPYTEESLARLRVEMFDTVICLDKEPGPCAVAMTVQANHRLGVGLSRYGTAFPLTQAAEYYFELGLDDEEKFHRNRKSMGELIYDAVGITYEGDRPSIEPTDEDRQAADAKYASFGASAVRRWVGINPGAGGVFAYKAWREAGYIELIRALAAEKKDVGFVLLGGPDEAALLARLESALADLPVFNAGPDNSLGAFTAIIDRIEVLVCGDTLAMHLAIARERRVVAIFGPTCEQEIDLFGLGVKIKSAIECSPCYRRECDKSPTCQDVVKDAQVIEALRAQLAATEKNSPASASRT